MNIIHNINILPSKLLLLAVIGIARYYYGRILVLLNIGIGIYQYCRILVLANIGIGRYQYWQVVPHLSSWLGDCLLCILPSKLVFTQCFASWAIGISIGRYWYWRILVLPDIGIAEYWYCRILVLASCSSSLELTGRLPALYPSLKTIAIGSYWYGKIFLLPNTVIVGY